MDFFGNVQNVEEGGEGRNETQWREELEAVGRMIDEARRRHNESLNVHPQAQHVVEEAKAVQGVKREGAAMVQQEQSWSKQIVGAAALAGCAVAWAAGSWLES